MAKIEFTLSSSNPQSHVLEVEMLVRDAKPEEIISLPAWTPGSYMIRDFAKNIVFMECVDDSILENIDKSSWRIHSTGNFHVRYHVYCFDYSPRGARVLQDEILLEGACIFLYIKDRMDEKIKLTIEGFQEKIYTTLPLVEKSTYESTNYYDLIDHPIAIGDFKNISFDVEGISHNIVFIGDFIGDQSILANDMSRICLEHHKMFASDRKPMSQYIFFLSVYEKGYGGLEHCHSSNNVISPECIPYSKEVNDDYESLIGLLSHEYFHAWNVKRIKPPVMIKPELSEEQYFKELWIFEGITSYYDNLALVRSGTITIEGYLKLLSKDYNLYQMVQGKQSLEEASYYVWTKFYKQEANSVNFTTSYYIKGAVVAFLLDLKIRSQTKSKKSLDTVMQTLWTNYGVDTLGVSVQMFEEIVNEIAGCDMTDFFNCTTRSSLNLPYEELIQLFGLGLVESTTQQKRYNPALQFGMHFLEGSHQVRHVLSNSVAESFGVCPDDEVLALNSIKFSKALLTSGRIKNEDIKTLHIYRKGRLLELTRNTAHTFEKFSYELTIRDNQSLYEQELFKAWIKGAVK